MRRAPRPISRTLRVWHEGRDITDEAPTGWPWPYSDWWEQGWRPATGPNAAATDEAGVGPARAHSTSEYIRDRSTRGR